MDFAASRVAIFGPSAFNKIELNVLFGEGAGSGSTPFPQKKKTDSWVRA